jgi:phenylpyruvate tautomerase PptA (4-oxalocrotonate tautomerase family)
MGQEIDPLTDIGRAATPVMFNEIDAHNWFPGGVPLVEHPEKTFFIVEAVVAASFFSQPRRDALQTSVAKAFVEVLGNDGSVLDREGVAMAPAYLMRLHTVIIEIPEGSWGAGGRTVDTELIGKLIGATQGPERFAEARAIAIGPRTSAPSVGRSVRVKSLPPGIEFDPRRFDCHLVGLDPADQIPQRIDERASKRRQLIRDPRWDRRKSGARSVRRRTIGQSGQTTPPFTWRASARGTAAFAAWLARVPVRLGAVGRMKCKRGRQCIAVLFP